MSSIRLLILTIALLLMVFYFNALANCHDHSIKGGSGTSKRTVSYAPSSGLEPPTPTFVPIERQLDGLLVPQLMFGSVIPIAVLVGIGLILVKLFAIGLWALKSGGGVGLGGGYPGGLGGGFGGGYPGGFGGGGYGGYGGYGGGYGASGWRSDQGFGRSMIDEKGFRIPPFIATPVMNLLKHFSHALEKYDKMFDGKSSEGKSSVKAESR